MRLRHQGLVVLLLAACASPASSAPEPDAGPDAGPDATAEPWPWPRCEAHATPDGSLAAKAAALDALVRARALDDELLRTVTVDDAGAVVLRHPLPSSGLWTAMYLASQSYRYAVTGDPEAVENAATAVAGLHHLTAVTGKDGLYGRAYQRPGFDYPGDVSTSSAWVASPAPGYEGWWFNHDVSKDTMDGIVYGYGVALEHLPDRPALDQVRADLTAFARVFVADGLQIIDHDGEVTEHGRLFYSAFDDFPGFNAILALAWIRAAIDAGAEELRPLYDDCLLRLGGDSPCPDLDIADLGSYVDVIEDALALYVPDCQTSYDNIDMVFQAAWTLLRRETDPTTRARLLAVLDHGIWRPDEPDETAPPVHVSGHALYIFMYGALAGAQPGDATFEAALADGLCTLHALPEDRSDATIAAGSQEGVCLNRLGRPNAAEVIPLAERYYDNYIWRLDPYEIPEAHEGAPGMVHSPEDFLLAYWLGRHLGFVDPAE